MCHLGYLLTSITKCYTPPTAMGRNGFVYDSLPSALFAVAQTAPLFHFLTHNVPYDGPQQRQYYDAHDARECINTSPRHPFCFPFELAARITHTPRRNAAQFLLPSTSPLTKLLVVFPSIHWLHFDGSALLRCHAHPFQLNLKSHSISFIPHHKPPPILTQYAAIHYKY